MSAVDSLPFLARGHVSHVGSFGQEMLCEWGTSLTAAQASGRRGLARGAPSDHVDVTRGWSGLRGFPCDADFD